MCCKLHKIKALTSSLGKSSTGLIRCWSANWLLPYCWASEAASCAPALWVKLSRCVVMTESAVQCQEKKHSYSITACLVTPSCIGWTWLASSTHWRYHHHSWFVILSFAKWIV